VAKVAVAFASMVSLTARSKSLAFAAPPPACTTFKISTHWRRARSRSVVSCCPGGGPDLLRPTAAGVVAFALLVDSCWGPVGSTLVGVNAGGPAIKRCTGMVGHRFAACNSHGNTGSTPTRAPHHAQWKDITPFSSRVKGTPYSLT